MSKFNISSKKPEDSKDIQSKHKCLDWMWKDNFITIDTKQQQ